jgi:hypothetical protein
MARKRNLSTKISTDKDVNKLASEYGPMAALLYTWMIPHAEDDRSITADPEEILLTVIPGFKGTLTSDDIDKYLKGMIHLGLLEDWGDGNLYFPDKSFYEHQTYIPESRRNHRKMPQNAAKCHETPQNASSLSLSPSLIDDDDDVRAREEGKIFEYYKQNYGLIVPAQVDLIGSYIDDGLSADLIIKILEGGLGKNDKWSWVKKVLQNCLEGNVKTVSDYEAKKVERKSRDHPPNRAADKEDRIRKATQEAFEELKREGIIDEAGRSSEDNRPP